jgi:hypothetical protein
MAQELNLSTEETAALDRIDAELQGSPGRAVAGAKALEVGDLCEKYQALRPSLVILVKIVKKIPGIGGKIGATLEFLMGLADLACPV